MKVSKKWKLCPRKSPLKDVSHSLSFTKTYSPGKVLQQAGFSSLHCKSICLAVSTFANEVRFKLLYIFIYSPTPNLRVRALNRLSAPHVHL